jgi:hypothetical protein
MFCYDIIRALHVDSTCIFSIVSLFGVPQLVNSEVAVYEAREDTPVHTGGVSESAHLCSALNPL